MFLPGPEILVSRLSTCTPVLSCSCLLLLMAGRKALIPLPSSHHAWAKVGQTEREGEKERKREREREREGGTHF